MQNLGQICRFEWAILWTFGQNRGHQNCAFGVLSNRTTASCCADSSRLVDPLHFLRLLLLLHGLFPIVLGWKEEQPKESRDGK